MKALEIKYQGGPVLLVHPLDPPLIPLTNRHSQKFLKTCFRDEVHTHLAMLIGTVPTKFLPHPPSILSVSVAEDFFTSCKVVHSKELPRILFYNLSQVCQQGFLLERFIYKKLLSFYSFQNNRKQNENVINEMIAVLYLGKYIQSQLTKIKECSK